MSAALRPRSAVRTIFGSLGKVMAGKAGAGVLSLGYLMLAAPYLGPADFGVLVLIHAYVVLVAGLVAIPMWQAVVRYGAMADGDGAPARIARLLRFGARIELAAGLAAFAVAAALAPAAGRLLAWPDAAMALAVPYSIAVLASLHSTPSGYLQLIGRFDLIGLQHLVPPSVRLLGAGVAVALDLGLTGFIAAWMIAAAAEWASLWGMGLWQAHRRLGPVLLHPGPGRVTGENPGIWRFLLANSFDVTFRDLAARAAPLIVGWVLGPAAAGLYSVAQRATVVLSQPAQMLGNVAYAELSRIVAGGAGRRAVRRTLARVTGLSILAAVPAVQILAALSEPVVRLLAGEAFLAAAPLMVWLLAARAIATAVPPCAAALTAMGRPGASLAANLAVSLPFLMLLPLLLGHLGLAGAGVQALAQSLAAALVTGALAIRHSGRLRD